MSTNIKQIKVGEQLHYIDATYINGQLAASVLSDIQGQIHGVVDTYVIPTRDTNKSSDYVNVVESKDAQVSTTVSALNTLTGSATTNTFKVGDIILMGATSDGTNNFDRWVSYVSGDDVKLDVLETQVATHHHTITTDSAKALTGVDTPTYTTNNVAKVGAETTVVVSGTGCVVTNVAYSGQGSNTMAIATTVSSDADGVAHKHTVNSHSHSITLGHDTLVSSTASAYTTLTSAIHTPHEHSVDVTAAGATSASASFKYITDGSQETVITSLTDEENNTGKNTAGLSTDDSGDLTTSDQVSTDTIGSVVLTLSNGAHQHNLESAETDDVVTGVVVAPNVITSFSLTNNTSVAENVIVGVVKVSTSVVTSAVLTGTTTFLTGLEMSVNTSGVLSFTPSSNSVGLNAYRETVSTVGTITSATQSAAAPTITPTSYAQSFTSGKVSVSGTISSGGAHQHGFSHTHTIAGHTHTIASHTHTYNKTVQSGTASAYTSLTSATHTPHTHSVDVTAAGAASAGASFKYITGGEQTSVVQSLITDSSFSIEGSVLETNDTYLKLTGNISCPSLTFTLVSTKDLLTTDTITPAADGGSRAIASITFTSSNFINSVDGKTSTNIGGDGDVNDN